MSYYIEFIAVILITVAWIWGFEHTFKEGEIFGKPGEWMRKKVSNTDWEWTLKPIFDCKYCMASVHGTVFYILLLYDGDVIKFPFDGSQPWYMWIIFCFCCCGTTAILDNE